MLKSLVLFLFTFIFAGIATALIPNPFFIRMIPANALDYFFLFTTSLSLALLYYYYNLKKCKTCEITGYSGVLAGIFSFSCPICSKLLVLAFGYYGVLTYFEPLRPYLGFLSLIVIGATLYYIKVQLKKP